MVTELSGNVCLSDCDKCSAVPHDEIENCRQRNLVKQCRQDIKDLRGIGTALTDIAKRLTDVEREAIAQAAELQALRDKLGSLKTAEEIYADRAAREPHRTANDEIGKAMRDGLKGSKAK